MKLRNGRHADKKRQFNESIQSNCDIANNSESLVDMIDVTEDQKKDVELLKATLVNDENMTKIKEKLLSTLSYRLAMMETPELDLLETFPYFFTHSTLVKKYAHTHIRFVL